MKKHLAILAVLLVMLSCKSTTDFQTFYDNHKSEAAFSIGVSGAIARMFIPSEEKKLLGPLLKKSGKFRVLVFNENNRSVNKSFTRFVKGNDYEQLIRLSDKKDRVDIYFQEDKDEIIRELIIRIKTADEFVILACKTKLTSDDLETLGTNLDVSMR
ncbi:MAG: hypothetical protein COB98_11400 [Flavobacteriaceae bacterium]|nr:MAG: hypothetical protein COB98_11400 [Flavobacteriaceae bacterium]